MNDHVCDTSRCGEGCGGGSGGGGNTTWYIYLFFAQICITDSQHLTKYRILAPSSTDSNPFFCFGVVAVVVVRALQ